MLEYLKEKILGRKEKYISFYEYMQDCLYHPQYGYYMRPQTKIGKAGDFYTSSSVHSVFAETFVNLAVDIFRQAQKPLQFCEMGAGTGRFAQAFLDYLQTIYPGYYQDSTYVLIEKSTYHQQLQAETLAAHRQHVQWRSALEPAADFAGLFFSNELVDAFPVHVVEKRDGKLWEIGVTWSEAKQGLEEITYLLENQRLSLYLQEQDLQLVEGQRLEVPLEALQWVHQVNRWMKEGIWITVDYGYTHDHLQQPEYKRGSLLTYQKHRVDDQVLLLPGEKDMTAHVHFDTLKQTASTLGWQPMGFYSQSDFLLRSGILSLLEESRGGDPFTDQSLKRNRAIRHFIEPGGISSAFQVLVLGKGSYLGHTYTFQKPFSFDKFLASSHKLF